MRRKNMKGKENMHQKSHKKRIENQMFHSWQTRKLEQGQIPQNLNKTCDLQNFNWNETSADRGLSILKIHIHCTLYCSIAGGQEKQIIGQSTNVIYINFILF